MYPDNKNNLKFLFLRGILVALSALYTTIATGLLLPSQIAIVLINCNVIIAMIIRCMITRRLPGRYQVMLVVVFIYGHFHRPCYARAAVWRQDQDRKRLQDIYAFNTYTSWHIKCVLYEDSAAMRRWHLYNEELFLAWPFHIDFDRGLPASISKSRDELALAFPGFAFSRIDIFRLSIMHDIACKYEKRGSMLSTLISQNIIFTHMLQT